MTPKQTKLDQAIDALETARNTWWDGYRNNYPQQAALNDAIARVVRAYDRATQKERKHETPR